MKSALANVGENDISKMALELEKAGHSSDMDYISAHTNEFISILEELLNRTAPVQDNNETADKNVSEDTDYLKEQLAVIKSACEDYDDTTVYTALNKLQEKSWKAETAAMLAEIHDMLFLHSDFDGTAEKKDEFFINLN